VNKEDEIALGRIEKLGKRKRDAFLMWLETEKHLPEVPLEVLDTIMEVTKYKELYDPKNEEDIARLENIQELRSVASKWL
jgi:superfamily I DNA/RNA helicase